MLKKKSGTRVISKKRIKCYANNRNLKSRNMMLTVKVHRLQKRNYRLRKQWEQKNTDHSSPEAVVCQFLKKNQCHVTAEVKQKLVGIIICISHIM